MSGRLLLDGGRRVMVWKMQLQPVWSHSLLPSPRPQTTAWQCELHPVERRALLPGGREEKGAARGGEGGACWELRHSRKSRGEGLSRLLKTTGRTRVWAGVLEFWSRAPHL